MTLIRRAGPPVMGAYALTLLVATHWPGVSIQGPLVRSDLWLHAAAYFVLAIFTLLAVAAKARLTRARLRWTCLVLFAFAALDELSQPWFGRVAAASDWLADAVGIMLASVLMTLILEARRRNPRFQGNRVPIQASNAPVGAPDQPPGVARATATTDEPTHGPRPTDVRVRA